MKNKRLFCLPSLYYTHGSAGYACARVCITDKFLFSPPRQNIQDQGQIPPKPGFINIKSPGMRLICLQYLGILKREN